MRKITAIVLSLLLIVSLSLSVSAASGGTFLLKQYDADHNSIYCYGKQLPHGGKLAVSAGSQTVDGAVLTTLDAENVPVTVYCLVDSSTSRPESMKQQQEKMLLTFSGLMSGEDNMVLGLLDASLTEGKPMNDKSARDTAISGIEGKSWYTNLYDGMVQALDTLQTSTAYHTNRCLVILSDGHDDEKSAASADKVLKKIQETGIPVYTVILDTTSITQKETSYHNQFAEQSLGGAVYIPEQTDLSAAEIAQQIWKSIKSGSLIRIPMDSLENREADQQLSIRYDMADTRYEDTILIRASDLTPLEETVPEETTEKGGGGEKGTDLPLEILVVGGIVAALVIAGVAAFILLRKKPAPDHEEQQLADDFSSFESNAVSDISFEFKKDDTVPLDTDNWKQTVPVKGRCHVFAVAIMHPEVAADFYLTPNMETSFGRTSKADIILCSKDKKLSGLHGCFFWDGKMLLVRDMKSKNGTAVNGENCHNDVWLRLEDGATLRAGSYEYRINFQPADEY